MKKLVVILDYQLGNLFSVKQACQFVGINAIVSSDQHDLLRADAIILPGVGAFSEAMANMRKLDLTQPLNDHVQSGKPLFGICLGQQLLFTESEEFGTSRGLNLIPGVIRKFVFAKTSNPTAKVPQIGWNSIRPKTVSWQNSPLAAIKNDSYLYFVHSYFVEPENPGNILSVTNYEGIEYCSSVIKNPNIFATQFHPEKSGELGLGIYRAWGTQFNLI